jgi:potassium-transporting ATPase potassium-binding subunit
MTISGWEQLAFVAAVTVVAAPLLGRYLAATFRGGKAPGDRVFLPVERGVYRVLGVDPDSSWTWRAYALAVLVFGLVSTLLLYAILRLQGVLPGNPAHAAGMSPLLSFNTAVSFITGTNWQAYEGETQASYLADTVGLVVAQFTAAGVGLAVALAVVRGIAGRGEPGCGAEPQRLPDRYHARGRDPEDPRRTGRLDGGDQAAWYQRRQLLRRRRCPPV